MMYRSFCGRNWKISISETRSFPCKCMMLPASGVYCHFVVPLISLAHISRMIQHWCGLYSCCCIINTETHICRHRDVAVPAKTWTVLVLFAVYSTLDPDLALAFPVSLLPVFCPFCFAGPTNWSQWFYFTLNERVTCGSRYNMLSVLWQISAELNVTLHFRN